MEANRRARHAHAPKARPIRRGQLAPLLVACRLWREGRVYLPMQPEPARNKKRRKLTCQGLADAASANDSNFHNDSFQYLLLIKNCYAALTFFSVCGVARSCCSHIKVVPTTPACSTRICATAAAVSVLAQSLCSSAAKTIQVIGMAPA